MNRISILATILLLFLSCQNPSTECLIESDPMPKGPLAYQPILYLDYPKQVFPEYDSLLFTYLYAIEKGDWSDSHHDSLYLTRHNPTSDTKYLEKCYLDGWNKDSNDWIPICRLFPLDTTPVDVYYYDELVQLLSFVADSVFSRQYYFEEDDWLHNKDIYQSTRSKTYFIQGKVRLLCTEK